MRRADFSSDFAVTVALVEGTTIVTTCGEVDVATAPVLREALVKAQLRDEPHHWDRPVVVDLSGVTFLDASALGVLAAAATRARRVGGDIVLRDPTPTAVRLLEITGLLRRFRLERESYEEAVVPNGGSRPAAGRRRGIGRQGRADHRPLPASAPCR